MQNLTMVTIFLAVAAVGTGAINSLGVIFYQGFPIPWFCDIGLILIWLRIRRELEYELERGRQTEA